MKNVNRMHGHCNFSHIVFSEVINRVGYPNTILELGCGNGGNLGKFSKVKIRIGIDPDEKNIENARYRDIDCSFILGDHTFLTHFDDNEFYLSFTFSVLDHMEDFRPALKEMMRISKNVILFEPTISGEDRLALPEETRWWKITWYHDYERWLKLGDFKYTIEKYPLYDEGSGELYHLIHINSEDSFLPG